MRLEKRSAPDPSSEPEAKDRKPVFVYIMILFIAAFLLMALSFFMHQRSNTEALGRLQSSVSAIQEVQATQDQVIALQRELTEAQGRIADLEEEAAADQVERDSLARQNEALLSLYQLQQHYSARELDACRELIEQFELGLSDSLPKEGAGGVTPPLERYQQLKAAVEALLAAGEPQAEE